MRKKIHNIVSQIKCWASENSWYQSWLPGVNTENKKTFEKKNSWVLKRWVDFPFCLVPTINRKINLVENWAINISFIFCHHQFRKLKLRKWKFLFHWDPHFYVFIATVSNIWTSLYLNIVNVYFFNINHLDDLTIHVKPLLSKQCV